MATGEWEAMSLDEFEAVWRAHVDERERIERGEWERMRMLAAIVVQPHCKRKITARQLLPFPWDGHERKGEVMTMEERRARAERARAKFG